MYTSDLLDALECDCVCSCSESDTDIDRVNKIASEASESVVHACTTSKPLRIFEFMMYIFRETNYRQF